VQDRHDVWVAGHAPHRSLLAVKVLEIQVVLIGTQHLDRDDTVE
jgi:hypothetical protein